MISTSRAIFLAAFCHQAYQQLEQGDITMPAGWRIIKELNATSGGRSEPFGFIAESPSTLVIAFRGTKVRHSPFDLISDLDLSQIPFPYSSNGGMTHRGFTQLYSRLRNQILQTLQTRSPRKRLMITGHSFGGALASYCALDMQMHTRFRAPIVYTLGSPRMGDETFCSLYSHKIRNSYRIYNTNDLVPREPPQTYTSLFSKQVWSYRHVRTGFGISFQLGNPIRNHDHTEYFAALSRLNPQYDESLRSRSPGFCPAVIG